MKLHPSTCFAVAFLILATDATTGIAGTSGNSPAADPTGTWKWTPTNSDGKTVEIVFTLKLQGETLTGTVTKTSGAMAITNGVVKGEKITFQTIREGKGGKPPSTTTYIGKLSGDTIAGKVIIDAGGKNFTENWEAKRVKQ